MKYLHGKCITCIHKGADICFTICLTYRRIIMHGLLSRVHIVPVSDSLKLGDSAFLLLLLLPVQRCLIAAWLCCF